MAGHAQLKFVMTECSKTQIRLTGLIKLLDFISSLLNNNLFYSKLCYNEPCYKEVYDHLWSAEFIDIANKQKNRLLMSRATEILKSKSVRSTDDVIEHEFDNPK